MEKETLECMKKSTFMKLLCDKIGNMLSRVFRGLRESVYNSKKPCPKPSHCTQASTTVSSQSDIWSNKKLRIRFNITQTFEKVGIECDKNGKQHIVIRVPTQYFVNNDKGELLLYFNGVPHMTGWAIKKPLYPYIYKQMSKEQRRQIPVIGTVIVKNLRDE